MRRLSLEQTVNYHGNSVVKTTDTVGFEINLAESLFSAPKGFLGIYRDYMRQVPGAPGKPLGSACHVMSDGWKTL